MADKFIIGLKSRSDEVRLKAAKELQRSVTTELREVSIEEYQSFWDELNHQIFELVSSSDVHERKGGILAISRSKHDYNSNCCTEEVLLVNHNIIISSIHPIV